MIMKLPSSADGNSEARWRYVCEGVDVVRQFVMLVDVGVTGTGGEMLPEGCRRRQWLQMKEASRSMQSQLWHIQALTTVN